MRFLLLDKITEWVVGDRARGIKNISLSEDYFVDHFPQKPIMPGVLIIEGMAQLAGVLLEQSVKQSDNLDLKALMTIVEKVKFRNAAYPGDTLVYTAEILRFSELGGCCKVTAKRDDVRVADGEISFSFHEYSDLQLDAVRKSTLELWLRDFDTSDL